MLNGVASAAYIGARLGPGPRDGLMTGLAARTGWSIRLVRTGIELTVLAVGWLLGGTVGIGTVAYALAIGPLTQAFLPWFAISYASRSASVHGRTTMSSTASATTAPPVITAPIATASLPSTPTSGDTIAPDAHLDRAEQRGRRPRGLTVAGQRQRGRVRHHQADGEQHRPQRRHHPDDAAGVRRREHEQRRAGDRAQRPGRTAAAPAARTGAAARR